MSIINSRGYHVKKGWIILVGIIGMIIIGMIVVGVMMSNVETPNYEVIEAKGNIEIRQYPPLVIAEVQISGERKEAINAGFRLLAGYIFGNNTTKQDINMTAPVQQQSSTKIAMTAPVQQQSSTKIAMTAPVQQQATGDHWFISFVMPSQYTIETLPKPVDQRVMIKAVPKQTFAVIKFSGMSSDSNINKHEKLLLDYLKTNKLSINGSPKYAFYNPPWTLPFMRRNEVMIEIKK